MHTAPATAARFVRHDRVQHFVIKNVLEEPERDEWLIEQWINPNDAIFFLDRSENEIFFRTLFTSTAPHHFVTTKPTAKIRVVELIENRAQIEVTPLMLQD